MKSSYEVRAVLSNIRAINLFSNLRMSSIEL